MSKLAIYYFPKFKNISVDTLKNIDIQIQPNKILFLVHLLNKYNDFNIGKIDKSNYDSEVLKYVLNKEGNEEIIKKVLDYLNKCNNIDFSCFYELCINNKNNAEFIEYMCILADQLARYGKRIYYEFFKYEFKYDEYFMTFAFFNKLYDFIDRKKTSVLDLVENRYSLQLLFSLFDTCDAYMPNSVYLNKSLNKKKERNKSNYPYVIDDSILTDKTISNFIIELNFLGIILNYDFLPVINKIISGIDLDRRNIAYFNSIFRNIDKLMYSRDMVKPVMNKLLDNNYSYNDLKKLNIIISDLWSIKKHYSIFNIIGKSELSKFICYILDNISLIKNVNIRSVSNKIINNSLRKGVEFKLDFIKMYMEKGINMDPVIKAM